MHLYDCNFAFIFYVQFFFYGSSLSDFCHYSQFHSVSNDYRENMYTCFWGQRGGVGKVMVNGTEGGGCE